VLRTLADCRAIIESDAAMRRGFLPTEQELNVALAVVEEVFAAFFGHKTEAEKLADRVPPRPQRPLRS
jgi:hypothetical protein